VFDQANLERLRQAARRRRSRGRRHGLWTRLSGLSPRARTAS